MEEVSIVVPAYNEESSIVSTIENVFKVMDRTGYEFEVIVVNDGSTDKTADLIHGRDIKLINHYFNKGYGAALKTGIKASKYRTILITDADGTYPLESIPDLLREIKDNDMVVGARIGGDIEIPLSRRPAKWFLTKLSIFLSGINIPDLNSGMRVFKKDIAIKFFNILPSGFSFTTSITLAMISNDYNIKYIPIKYYRRKGKSKINPGRDTFNFLLLIIRTMMYFNPLKVFLPLSLFFLFFSIGKIIFFDLIFLHDITDTSIWFFLIAIQIGIVGLLADLIDKRLS